MIDALFSDIEKLSSDLNESLKKCSSLEKDLASLSDDLNYQKSINDNLRETLELEKKAVLNLQNQLKEQESRIEAGKILESSRTAQEE